jgi:hypothetical protein
MLQVLRWLILTNGLMNWLSIHTDRLFSSCLSILLFLTPPLLVATTEVQSSSKADVAMSYAWDVQT